MHKQCMYFSNRVTGADGRILLTSCDISAERSRTTKEITTNQPRNEWNATRAYQETIVMLVCPAADLHNDVVDKQSAIATFVMRRGRGKHNKYSQQDIRLPLAPQRPVCALTYRKQFAPLQLDNSARLCCEVSNNKQTQVTQQRSSNK